MTAKLGGIAAVLVAFAALINGAIDLYKSFANIPIGALEKTEQEMLKTHFGKSPIFSEPITVKTSPDVTVQMLLQVFDNGDVFVRYGRSQRWLPFPRQMDGSDHRKVDLLFSEAYAQASISLPGSAETGRGPMREQLALLTIDIDKLKREKTGPAPSERKPNTIEKSYLVAEMKDDHPSLFHSSTRSYSRTYEAEPGYRIVKFALELATANHHRVERVELANEGKSVRVHFSLTSGPAYDRWRGWIQATLKTSQERVR